MAEPVTNMDIWEAGYRSGRADAEEWFADRLTHQWVRQCVADAMPLGYTDRDPYRNVNEAADAVLAVIAREVAP